MLRFIPSAAALCALLVPVLAPSARAEEAASPVRVDPTPPPPDKRGYTLFNPTPDSQLRAFSPDRPNKSTGPYTVDAGHFQYETDLFGTSYDGYSRGGANTRLFFTADPVVKLGVTNWMDVQVALGGYQNLRVATRGTGQVDRFDGFGDVTLRAKVNLWGNDGGSTAAAVVPFVKIPTAARGLGNDAVEFGVTVPFQVSLPYDLTALFVTEFDAFRNLTNTGKHAGFTNLVNVSRAITPKLTASVEFWSQVQAARVPNQYTLDLSLAYALGSNLQLDTAAYIGLNKDAPDIVGYVGLSQRF